VIVVEHDLGKKNDDRDRANANVARAMRPLFRLNIVDSNFILLLPVLLVQVRPCSLHNICQQ